ncbi:hypothetical protein Lser_V15G14523 [Lactuca serriola]
MICKVAEDENKENTIEQNNISLNSEYVALNSTPSDQPAVEKYRPPIPVKQSACCNCACGNNKRQGKDTPPGAGRNNFTVKKKICFHCGAPGHIAKNCHNHAYVPYYAQGWQNAPRGRYFKRNPLRSRSDHGDWKAQKAKNPTPKNKNKMSAKKPNPRDAPVNQRSVRSKSSQQPTSSLKSSIEPPIRSKKKWVKPNYKWVPKAQSPKSTNDSNISSSSICDKQDMSWERVPCKENKG